MSQVLYRKYRSKSLAEVLGQDHVTKTLQLALQKGALAHAYLLTGPRGVGKTSVARILAYEVNGIDYDESKFYPDIIEIDAASNGRVDEIRDLRDAVQIMPNELKYKVYIIDEVHMLSGGAFNALLKTLEEPPEHVIFILATTESHKVPKTIISRCQRFNFKHIDKQTMTEHLNAICTKESIKIDDGALDIIAEAATGSFRDALSILDQLSQSSSTITEQSAREVLGVADEAAVNQLLQHYSSADLASSISLYRQLILAGDDPIVLSKQLIDSLRGRLDSSSSLASDIQLMKDLLVVATARDPETQLELALLNTTGLSIAPIAPVLQTQTPAQPVEVVQSAPAKAEEPVPIPEPTQVEPKPKKTVEELVKPQQPKIEEEEEEEEQGEDQPVSTQSTSSLLTMEVWPEVLQEISKQRNSIYIILRMANVTIEDGKLLAKFKFAFHTKQLNESANKSYILEAVERCGYTIDNLEIVHDGSVNKVAMDEPDIDAGNLSGPPPPSSAPMPQHPQGPPPSMDDIPESVLNVFGGAELVD